MTRWVRTDSSGWSDKTQQVPWNQMLEWCLEIYLRSCWMYYHSTFDPVLTDAQHDANERILQNHFDELPDWFKQQVSNRDIKTSAHSLTIPKDVIDRAIKWRNQSNL